MMDPPLMFTVEPLETLGAKCRTTASSARLVFMFNMLHSSTARTNLDVPRVGIRDSCERARCTARTIPFLVLPLSFKVFIHST